MRPLLITSRRIMAVESIWASAGSGNLPRLVEWLRSVAEPVDAKDADERTPLHHAALAGHAELVALLLEKGAAADAVDEGGWTPLLSAASAGQVESSKALLGAGANANIRSGSGSTPLLHAASKGHLAVVELLLSHGADARAQDNGGSSALHRAAARGHVRVLEALLAARGSAATLELKDKGGHTPFHLAVLDQQEACCVLLAEGGAVVETENVAGEKAAEALPEWLFQRLTG